MHPSLTSSQVPACVGDSAGRASRLPFLAHAAVSPGTLIWSGLLGIALVTPTMLLSSLWPVSDHSRAAFASVAIAPAMGFLKHILLGPALEEVVYRGLFLQLGRRYLPLWWALVLSAVVFGATHFPGGPALVAGSALMAVLLGWIAVQTRSLLASFVCHAAFNFTAGFIVGPAFNLPEKLQAVPSGARMEDSMTSLFRCGGLCSMVW